MSVKGGVDGRAEVLGHWQTAKGAVSGAVFLLALTAYVAVVVTGCDSSEPTPPRISDRITTVTLGASSATDLPACVEAVYDQFAYVSSPPSLWWCAASGRWIQAGRLSERDIKSADAQLKRRHTDNISVATGAGSERPSTGSRVRVQ